MFLGSRLAMGVAGGLIVGFLSLFLMVGMTIWLSERANTFFLNSAALRDTRVAAVELRDALRTAESSQRGYLLTGNEIYLAPYDTAVVRARQQLSDVARFLSARSPPTPLLSRLQQAVAEKLSEMDQSIALK